MALRGDFSSKDLLEKEGYETESEVAEATDEELLSIDGIGPVKLDEIRAVAPFTESPSSTGSGETSGKTTTKELGPSTSTEPTAQSFQSQTSKVSKDQIDPTTGQELPKGIVRNVRGTLTASSTVDQDDMVSPERVKAEHKARVRQAGEKIAALME
jgi:hypothetical protein